MFELVDNLLIVLNTKQVLKFSEDMFVLSGIKFDFFLALKVLDLEKQMNKIVSEWHQINIQIENSFKSFIAFRVLAHSTIVNRISSKFIWLGQELSVPIHNVSSILFKQIINSNIEVFMPLHGLTIMEDRRSQMAMFDIHVFKSVSILCSKQLIEQSFLEINSFDVQVSYHAFKISFVAHHMIGIPPLIVNVNLLMNHVLWRTHFRDQIESNVFESKIPI